MVMKSLFTFVILILITLLADGQKITGFRDPDADVQKDWEKQFDAILSTGNMDAWMKYLSSRPNHVGSSQDKINAEYIAGLFRQWGYQTDIESYYVLFPTPSVRLLELNGDRHYRAKLEEPALKEDRTSGQKKEQLPTYNAYSADGDIVAEAVYVNYGVPADYEVLDRLGIDVKGKIVIARYGGSWRGIKPKVACEHGAVGCIIYSDPKEDGYYQGDVYPEGSFRPKNGVQRGSVLDMPVSPGDPLTPGVGATKEAKRIDRNEAGTIMKIPVLPVSWEDALPFLQVLGGPVAPESWRGALPITYHIGPGKDKVHLKLQFNWDIKPLYNVIAKLPGSEFPDEWIIRGNHHDSWVNGAADPISGVVSELEEARAISELVKRGYRLKRTLVYCAWDGEEPGLLGSTEWTEDHHSELREKGVLYINTDGNSRGFISAAGSHSLTQFFNEITGDVIDPQTGVNVRERKYALSMVNADASSRCKLNGDRTIELGALGAGSDWSGFLQFTGISSLNLAFGGEGEGGEYHSIYDSYDHFVRFLDPGFHYEIALAEITGRAMMRMASAYVLPFDVSGFYHAVSGYLADLQKLLGDTRTETEQENAMIADNLFYIAADPLKHMKSPKKKDPVPYLDFSDLENSMMKLRDASEELQKISESAVSLPARKADELNQVLFRLERSLINEKGLPGRPWYKHQIYAPGLYTGYGVKTMPGIREAIEQRDWKGARDNIVVVSQAIDNYTSQVNRAIKIIRSVY
jgi:N-acetylated-alpha-linked acidic dipeptidase